MDHKINKIKNTDKDYKYKKDEKDNSLKSKKDPLEAIKKEIENPASPIKSYLSGGCTPPRKVSVESPCSSSLDSFTGKLADSECSQTNSLKRKYSSDLSTLCETSEKSCKQQRKDSDDSGLGSYKSSCEDRNRMWRKSSVELFSAPLDDILNGSVMPYLPETTKIQERGELY